MNPDYPYDKLFQRKLLALLLREPEKVLGLVEAQYFSTPIHVEVSRVAKEAYTKHGTEDFRLSRSSVMELVKTALATDDDDVLRAYKSEIKKVFKIGLSDVPILVEQAKEFAKEQRSRDALTLAEKHITNHRYDRAFSVIEDAYNFVNAKTVSSWSVKWKDLPHPLDFPFEEVDWTIEGILPTDAVIAVSGDEGTGKTLQMLHWARPITEGTEFLGRRAYPRKVLYLGIDVSRTTLLHYMRMMHWVPNGDFRILSLWTGDGNQPPMLDDPVSMERLYEIARLERPVIIFDTVRDFYSGEENSSTETKPILDAVRKLRSLGATVILLTHPPKSGSSVIRGSGVVSQKVDIPYLLSKVKRGRKEYAVLSCPKKNRFGSTSFSLTMEMQFIPIPGNVPCLFLRERPTLRSTESGKADDDLQSIVEYLEEHPRSTQLQIQRGLHMGDSKVKELVSLGRTKGLLHRTRGRGNTLHWSIATEEPLRPEHEGFDSADFENAETAAPKV